MRCNAFVYHTSCSTLHSYHSGFIAGKSEKDSAYIYVYIYKYTTRGNENVQQFDTTIQHHLFSLPLSLYIVIVYHTSLLRPRSCLDIVKLHFQHCHYVKHVATADKLNNETEAELIGLCGCTLYFHSIPFSLTKICLFKLIYISLISLAAVHIPFQSNENS